MTNKHGLWRDIPADVKRAVRQRDGFGCVRCGSAIYTYEHVDPTFEEARTHEAAAITLLCAACHDLVTRGLLSKETVKHLMQVPKCLEDGFSFGPFDLGPSWPSIRIGTVTLEQVAVILRAAGKDVLRVDPPEQAGAPFRMTARLTDRSGSETLTIVENEWRSSAGNWDVEVVGPRITIRSAPREIALILRADPPRGLVVERLNMSQDGVHIQATESDLTVGAGGRTTFTASSVRISGFPVGIDVDPDGSARVGVVGRSMHVGHIATGAAPKPRRAPLPRPRVPSIRASADPPRPAPVRRTGPKPGRNAPCPCGSGTKYKRCCGRPQTA